MIDVGKFYDRLDHLDPRLFPIIIEKYTNRGSDRTEKEILRDNLKHAEVLMSVLNDDSDNLLRVKGGSVIRALQDARQAVAEGESVERNEGKHDHLARCGQVAKQAITEKEDGEHDKSKRDHNEGQRDHFVRCGQTAMDALGMVYSHTAPDDIRKRIMGLANVLE